MVAPENTLASFRKALVGGADGIEFDLHRCKSGELVVIHDETVDRTTDGKGAVAQLTLAELRKLHISGGEHIPTFNEVLERFGQRVHYFIECKTADAVTHAAETVAHMEKSGWPKGRLCLITFLLQPLQTALRVFPSLTAGASFEKWENDSVRRAKAMGANTILPNFAYVTPAHAREARAAGLRVIPWTVNAPGDIERLRALGVEGIISDYPERLAISDEAGHPGPLPHA